MHRNAKSATVKFAYKGRLHTSTRITVRAVLPVFIARDGEQIPKEKESPVLRFVAEAVHREPEVVSFEEDMRDVAFRLADQSSFGPGSFGHAFHNFCWTVLSTGIVTPELSDLEYVYELLVSARQWSPSVSYWRYVAQAAAMLEVADV